MAFLVTISRSKKFSRFQFEVSKNQGFEVAWKVSGFQKSLVPEFQGLKFKVLWFLGINLIVKKFLGS
jgi:hypothetical protein